jgi:hypothetical protein
VAAQAERRPVAVAPQARNQVRPALDRAEQLAFEAGRRKRLVQQLLRGLLVAGRVDRVESDQPLEQLGGAAFELRGLGHARESRTCMD